MTVFQKADNVVCRVIAGETLLVPVQGSLADMRRLFVLEGCGAEVWELLDGRRRTGEIRDELARRYDVPAAEAGVDLMALLNDLRQAGLITEAGG